MRVAALEVVTSILGPLARHFFGGEIPKAGEQTETSESQQVTSTRVLSILAEASAEGLVWMWKKNEFPCHIGQRKRGISCCFLG